MRVSKQRVMKKVARITRQSLAVLRGNPSRYIDGITEKRMSCRSKVNADLVRPPGGDPYQDK